MQIVPIENIQGRKAVEGGDMCLRKTTNGVDLNRNWGYAWVKVRSQTCNDHTQVMPYGMSSLSDAQSGVV